ncbi:MAG: energy-coupled thiamine transporter ThiT [Eubacteriales bacterium]|nr:energy-coupled thiamine transporter ThiT [Eubacteriales bacterium]MDD4583272.1 energy-coupled thiamine transporter ThiT [Eubacteriales bacterium]
MSAEQLQGFFESLTGQIITVTVIILLFGGILISGKKRKTDIKALVLSAIFVALYLVLNQIMIFRMPQGGSITAFSMLTITACAYLLGTRRAVMAGMCAGLVGLIFNPYVIHPIQLLLDYPLAVGALGLAGLAGSKKYSLQIGYLLGVLFRYLCALLSGIIFFGEYAPEGFNAFTWSIYYNISYIGPEAIITLIILFLPPIPNTFRRLRAQIN